MKRAVLAVGLAAMLGGCPPVTDPVTPVHSRAKRQADIAANAVADIDESNDAQPERPSYQYPRLVRHEKVVERQRVDGVRVVIETAGAAGWRINIRNDTEKLARLVWDDSSFVMPTDVTEPLISGRTKKMNIGLAQSPAAIPPGAALNEDAFVDYFLGAEELELTLLKQQGDRGRMLTTTTPEVERLRAARRRLIIGGSLWLMIEVDGTDMLWRGSVELQEGTE